MSKAKQGLDTYKKKDNHYIDKKEFYDEMAAFKQDPENIRLVEAGKRPNIPDSIARKILLLCERHSYNYKFGDRFPFRDEMVLDAVETCIRYIWNFDETKYDNPYGYFNLCISREFIKRIKKEKKDFIKRAKYIQNLGVMEEFMGNGLFADDTIDQGGEVQTEIRENLQRFLDYDTDEYDRKEKEKKRKAKEKAKAKKAEDSLDKFTGDDDG